MEIPPEFQARIRVLPHGCWQWLGNVVGKRNKTGSLPYGTIIRNGRTVRVHRVFYQRATGIDPGKNHVHHKCHNTLCVNPDHLEAMTQADHNRIHQNLSKSQQAARDSPTCRHGHLWSEHAYVWRGTRYCRACTAECQRKRRKEQGVGLKGRGYNMRQKTHCPQGHPYEGANLKVTPQGVRLCRTCRNAYIRDLRARNKANQQPQP